jgi:hypothetical protein
MVVLCSRLVKLLENLTKWKHQEVCLVLQQLGRLKILLVAMVVVVCLTMTIIRKLLFNPLTFSQILLKPKLALLAEETCSMPSVKVKWMTTTVQVLQCVKQVGSVLKRPKLTSMPFSAAEMKTRDLSLLRRKEKLKLMILSEVTPSTPSPRLLSRPRRRL